MEQHRVLVLGYGEMGHAMEALLAGRVRLDIWEKFPADGFRSAVLEDVVPAADLILFCLPVNPHREVVTQLLPLLGSNAICLSIAKGLDEKGQTAAEIFTDVLGERHPYALLYGPMIAEELQAGRYGFAQLGCKDDASYQTVRDVFADTRLFIERSPDITGISWSVILKNVYAMIFGMADELHMGDNVRGYLAVASISELEQITLGMGGAAGSPWHLAGLGDLVTTATSRDSHHHELGCMLARGEVEGIQGEGVHTLEMVSRHGLFREKDYPLFELIHSIVRSPGDVKNRIDAYLRKYAGSGQGGRVG